MLCCFRKIFSTFRAYCRHLLYRHINLSENHLQTLLGRTNPSRAYIRHEYRRNQYGTLEIYIDSVGTQWNSPSFGSHNILHPKTMAASFRPAAKFVAWWWFHVSPRLADGSNVALIYAASHQSIIVVIEDALRAVVCLHKSAGSCAHNRAGPIHAVQHLPRGNATEYR